MVLKVWKITVRIYSLHLTSYSWSWNWYQLLTESLENGNLLNSNACDSRGSILMTPPHSRQKCMIVGRLLTFLRNLQAVQKYCPLKTHSTSDSKQTQLVDVNKQINKQTLRKQDLGEMLHFQWRKTWKGSNGRISKDTKSKGVSLDTKVKIIHTIVILNYFVWMQILDSEEGWQEEDCFIWDTRLEESSTNTVDC